MRDGYELTLFHEGIRLDARLAYALGLRDGATCWGVWIEGRGRRVATPFSELDDINGNPQAQGPHMVVSPIHPAIWPSSLRIELRLRRKIGMIRSALNQFRKLNLKPHSLSSATGGYQSIILTAFCEHEALTRHTSRSLKELEASIRHIYRSQRSRGDVSRSLQDVRVDVFRQIGRHALASVVGVQARLRLADDERITGWSDGNTSAAEMGDPFLDPTIRQIGSLPWSLDSHQDFSLDDVTARLRDLDLLQIKDHRTFLSAEHLLSTYSTAFINAITKDLKEFRVPLPQPPDVDRAHMQLQDEQAGAVDTLMSMWQSHSHDPVSVRALTTLAYARVWQYPGQKPLRLRYDQTDRMLRPVDKAGHTRGGVIQDGFIRNCEVQASTERTAKAVRRQLRKDMDQPATLLASINRPERSLRLRVIRGEFARESSIVIEVHYSLRVSGSSITPCIYELIDVTSNVLLDEALLIDRLRTWTKDMSTCHQSGVVTMICTPDEWRQRAEKLLGARKRLIKHLQVAGKHFVRTTPNLNGSVRYSVRALSHTVESWS